MTFNDGFVLPFPLSKGFLFLHTFFRETHTGLESCTTWRSLSQSECDVSRDLKTLPEEGDKTLICSPNISETYFLFSQIVMTTLTETGD